MTMFTCSSSEVFDSAFIGQLLQQLPPEKLADWSYQYISWGEMGSARMMKAFLGIMVDRIQGCGAFFTPLNWKC